MSEAPFRELFVELPRQLFEALQGIGEAAVKKAQAAERPSGVSYLRSTMDVLAGRMFAGIMREQFGWHGNDVFLLADRDAFELRTRLSCGHLHRIEFDARSIALAPSSGQMFEYIFDRLEAGANDRLCSCVLREVTA